MAAESAWNQAALFDMLHKVLEDVKDRLADRELPMELHCLIALTIRINECLQDLQSITDYKRKSPVADHNVLLPDRLNNFFACFEDNTVQLTWPATKTCRLSFTVANMSKTFKRVNPRKAAGPDGIPGRIL